ncbi:salicylic acid-binding protein 2-like [Chenopodium quinoa]|uniref:AB hydrolase-1 domain-containing protein n=1 Tax=Chenopodium quinoa TaxID=63459 RepID=A0A803LE13_CHEQI|nr:salicylic acid-binding protein 2-like [Chenopodium quinoa]
MLKRNLHQGLISLKILLIIFVVIEASYEQLDHQHSHKPLSKHFVLVHGSCLGAWSWYKLLPLLKSSGHTVTAIDLAASGINPLQPNDLQSISEYFQPLADLMVSLPSDERVILVGHSLGGLAISHAMQHFPDKISAGVFVTAQMPGPNLNVSILSQELLNRSGPGLDNKFMYNNGPNNTPTTFLFGPNFLSQKVYDLSPPEDIALASTLMRPLRLFSMQDMSEVIVLTDQKYGSVPRVYIISEEDKITDKEVERWMLKKNPPNRVEKIKGSDHMVMVSQPLQLWVHLQSIAADFD